MEKRSLGQGLEVSALSLGAMGYGKSRDIPDRQEMIALLRRPSTSAWTSSTRPRPMVPGQTKRWSAKLSALRDKVKIATKFGWDIDQDTGEHRGGVNSKPAQIRRAAEGSLRRLGTDYIDLYYQHRVDPEVPMEEVAGVVKDLIRQGKVRFFGLSEAGAKSIRRAHAVQPVAALQSEYSLWTREPEDGIIPTLEELGIGMVPFSPLGKGFLTGASTRARRSTNATSAVRFRASLPARARSTSASSDCCGKSAIGAARPRRRSRSPGFLPRSRGSCRCSERARSGASRRT